MKKKLLTIVIVFLTLLSVGGSVFAENNIDVVDSSVKAIEGNNDDIVANVDFENVTVKQDEKDPRHITISFEIVNHHIKVLSDFVNSVQVVKGYGVFFEQIDPKTTTIAPQSSVKKVVNLTVPQFVGGDVSLRLIGVNRNGLVLEDYTIDNIILPEQVVKGIVAHDCSLFINGKEQHLLSDGVDISMQENLSFECDVDNKSDQDISYTPEINVYAKSIYSGKIEKTWKGKEDVLTKQSTKTVNFDIPHPQSPGYYDVTLGFLQNNNKITSETVAHFVVQGESASLSFVSFDKEQYKKGDAITAKILIAGSADSFPGSRSQKTTQFKDLTIKGTVISDGKKCTNDIEKKLSGESGVSDVVVKQTANIDCEKPVVSLSLYDENGKLLDSKEYKLYTENNKANSATTTKEVQTSSQNNKSDSKTMILILTVLFVVTLSVLLIYSNKNHTGGSDTGTMGLFVLVTTVGVLAGTHSAFAGVTRQCGPNSMYDYGYCYYDINPVTGSCSKIKAQAKISWFVCNNHEYRGLEVEWRPTVNDQFENLVSGYQGYVLNCTDHGTYRDFGHCPFGTSGVPGVPHLQVTGNACIEDSSCNKTYYGFYCPSCRNMTDYRNKFVNANGMPGDGIKSDVVEKTVEPGTHTAKFIFKFRDIKDVSDNHNVKYDVSYTVPPCPPQCTGLLSAGMKPCPGTTTGLTKDTGWELIDNCENAGDAKCKYEFQCSDGDPTKQPPFKATWCPGDDHGLTSRTNWHEVSACTTTDKCEYYFKPECGPANKHSFSTETQVEQAGLCETNNTASSIDSSGLEVGDPWTWTCSRSGQTIDCKAYQIGQCNSNHNSLSLNSACTAGKINSIYFDGTTLTWACGTLTNGQPANPPLTLLYNNTTITGYNFTHLTVTDSTEKYSSGADCSCTPQYQYSCVSQGYDCNNKCGQNVTEVYQAYKKDSHCFPGNSQPIPIAQQEYNNHNSTTCTNKPVTCPPCGVGGGGSDTINETN